MILIRIYNIDSDKNIGINWNRFSDIIIRGILIASFASPNHSNLVDIFLF